MPVRRVAMTTRQMLKDDKKLSGDHYIFALRTLIFSANYVKSLLCITVALNRHNERGRAKPRGVR